MDAFEAALKLDPSNSRAKSGLESVRQAIDAETRVDRLDVSGGMGSTFDEPQLYLWRERRAR